MLLLFWRGCLFEPGENLWFSRLVRISTASGGSLLTGAAVRYIRPWRIPSFCNANLAPGEVAYLNLEKTFGFLGWFASSP